MTNEITFKLKAVAEDLDNTAANLWHVGGINMHARTCENVAESLRSLIAKVESLAADAERWNFMMRIADNQEGPEAQAMESLRIANDQMESDRLASVQLIEMVDQARDARAKEKA